MPNNAPHNALRAAVNRAIAAGSPVITEQPAYKRTAPNQIILWEGACAYVVKTGECHEIIVHSSNYVTHKPAGITDDAARAESICRRLNAYPRQTRAAFGLL